MKQIILIGDSIRMGYQPIVQKALADRAEVWGPTENGGTTRNVLQHLEEWVLQRSADLVHLNCGLHDLAKEFDTQQPRVALAEYTENLRQIFQIVRDQTAARLIWARTTPVNQDNHNKHKQFNRFEADVSAYNQAADQVARQSEVPVNDLHSIVTEAGRDEFLLDDGVHFSKQGYQLLGAAVAETLRANA